MTELKTLNEIAKNISSKDPIVYQTKIEIFHELKQEAIKWIKEYKTFKYPCMIEIIEWIKHFFNITKEDLK